MRRVRTSTTSSIQLFTLASRLAVGLASIIVAAAGGAALLSRNAVEASCGGTPIEYSHEDPQRSERRQFFAGLSEGEWRARLSEDRFNVLRQGGTEPAFSGRYWRKEATTEGTYVCAACSAPVFAESSKFHSYSGWPSFSGPLEDAVLELPEQSRFGRRVEVRCSICSSHLGHIIGPKDQGGHYCINSLALKRLKTETAPSETA
ncbi:Mss4-like protein [Hyaloraphidium curvatum]|nr:Mss4-like protein [Hyaloraphidium curvatum]